MRNLIHNRTFYRDSQGRANESQITDVNVSTTNRYSAAGAVKAEDRRREMENTKQENEQLVIRK